MSSVRGEGDNGSLWEAGSGVGGEQEALITRSKFRRLGGKQEAGGERRAGSGGQSLASTSRPEKKL